LVEVVGYGKANIAKIANKYRYELLARSDSSKALLNWLMLSKCYMLKLIWILCLFLKIKKDIIYFYNANEAKLLLATLAAVALKLANDVGRMYL